jgi:hypothetical protein
MAINRRDATRSTDVSHSLPSDRLPAVPRQRPNRSTVSLPPRLRQRLEARGARSDKGHGPFAYTAQLARTLELYDSVLGKSDPRHTAGMTSDHYELVLDILTDPLALAEFHILRLGDYLFELAAFKALAHQRQIDPRQFCDTLNGYPFAEKLHLVDAAQVLHAPPRPPRRKDPHPRRPPRGLPR